MNERKQVTGGRAGIGTVVLGIGLGLVLTTLWGIRYRRTHRFAPTSHRAELLANSHRLHG